MGKLTSAYGLVGLVFIHCGCNVDAARGAVPSVNQTEQVWLHIRGKPQTEDVYLYAHPEQPSWQISVAITVDGG
jgi:hypothetical protein